jgi:hypothetical protein
LYFSVIAIAQSRSFGWILFAFPCLLWSGQHLLNRRIIENQNQIVFAKKPDLIIDNIVEMKMLFIENVVLAIIFF